MAVMVEAGGVALALRECGAGPPLLLVHDMASDAEDLGAIADRLASRARVLAYDRRGYGDSGAPVPYEATTVQEQAQDAAALLTVCAGGPALVCGIGFGALIALDLLTRHAGLLRGAVLADPPLYAFVAEAAEALSEQRRGLEEALREGGPERAVARLLGPDVPPERVAHAQRAHRAVFADLAGLATWPVTRAGLRAIGTPVTVLTGPATPGHVLAAADTLAALLPAAHRVTDGDLVAAA